MQPMDAMAALRKELEGEMAKAQTGKIILTQTHENISTGQKFSPSDFDHAF